jgi:hypothetical protein
MSIAIPQSVRDAADISAVTQLVLTERESRDLGRWEAMRNCFQEDSLVRISWFTGNGADFVAGSQDMARRKVLAKHRLGPVLVRLGGDRAVASLSGIIDIPAEVHGVAVQLSSHARFLFRAQRHFDQWRLKGFDAIYQRDEFTTAVPGRVLPISDAELAPFRPSYRMLSYLLASQGFTVNPNLPGDDRPESAAALHKELFDWAGIPF